VIGGTQSVGFLQGSGTASHTTIESGGTQVVGYDYGTGVAIDTTISSGGLQVVGDYYGSGTASGTIVNSGGVEIVGRSNGSGTAFDTTINSGGIEYVSSGGTASDVTFGGASATLDLVQPGSLSGTISGWQVGDVIETPVPTQSATQSDQKRPPCR